MNRPRLPAAGKKGLESFFLANEAGLTLVEVIVTLSIILLISGILIIEFTGDRLGSALARSSNELVLNIKQARSLTLATKRFQGQSIPFGWGVHFLGANSRDYVIFADLDGDNQRNQNSSEDDQKISFDPGIFISSVSLSDVIFIPPDPKTIFTPSQNQATIILSNGKQTRTIIINSFGSVTY